MTSQRPVTAPVPATLDAIIAQATDAALAANTRRSYRAAWRLWQAWARTQDGADPDAPTPAVLGHYLAHRVASGVGVGTLRRDLAALRWVCRTAGKPDPSTDPRIARLLAGFARQAADAGASPVQAAGLTRDAVMRIRGHLTTPQAAASPARSRRAKRDMALISLLACAGLRRSEAARLTWAQIAAQPDGSGRLTIPRSKTDPAGQGAVVALTSVVVADLEDWAAAQGAGRTGPVFGLSDRQIARRVAAVAVAAGLGPGFTGHSGRVGMAQTMTAAGAPVAVVARQGRWSTERMVLHYTRAQAAGDALPYL